MVKIDAAEKAALLKKFPHLTFVRTMKQDSKRHNYYCVEDWKVMEYLRVLRGQAHPRPKYNHRNNNYKQRPKRRDV